MKTGREALGPWPPPAFFKSNIFVPTVFVLKGLHNFRVSEKLLLVICFTIQDINTHWHPQVHQNLRHVVKQHSASKCSILEKLGKSKFPTLGTFETSKYQNRPIKAP